MELVPRYPPYKNRLSFALAENGEFEMALEVIEEALTIQPNTAYLMETKGTVLLLMGDFQNSVSAYRRAVELAPRASHHYTLGLALRGLGQETEAQAEINIALELEPALEPPPEGGPLF